MRKAVSLWWAISMMLTVKHCRISYSLKKGYINKEPLVLKCTNASISHGYTLLPTLYRVNNYEFRTILNKQYFKVILWRESFYLIDNLFRIYLIFSICMFNQELKLSNYGASLCLYVFVCQIPVLCTDLLLSKNIWKFFQWHKNQVV